MMVSSPAFLNPCYYGVDIDNRDNLIAVHHTVEEIADIIGADSVGYLSVESLAKLAPEHHANAYCSACFDGNYPTEVPKTQLKNKFEQKISESQEEDNA